jgi:predicted permease
MRVVASGPKYDDEHAVDAFYQEVGNRITRLPGVESEGVASDLPLTGEVGWGGIGVEGYTPPPGQELQVDLRVASADYFRTMRIPLLKGRFFSVHDTNDTQKMAIVDAKFAQRFWPHENPVGKHLWFDPKKPFTIAGVVGVVKQYGLDTEGKILVYFPQRQQLWGRMYVVARTSSDPAGLANTVIREIHAVDPGVVVDQVATMQDRLYDSLARQRFSSTILAGFAGFALLLAAVGVFGVMSWLVSQTTHDMGVRLALGAQPGDILSLVIRQGMALAGLGIAGGLVGAVLLTRVMTSLLYGVSATDLATFSAVVVILAAAAFAATAIPAFRASRVDPMLALRVD